MTFAGFGTITGPTYESTIGYTYDAGNRLTQAVDSVTGTISRTYDGLDRMTEETTPQGSVSYGYDAAGRRTSMTVGSLTAVSYTYDNANRLTQLTQGTPTVSFSYDSANRRTSLTLPNGVTMSYSYDSASEMTGIGYATSSTTLGNLTYSYDLGGRRASMGGSFAAVNLPSAISTTGYDAANELTAWGTSTPTYDSNGNTTSDGTNSYVWNARNQLASMNSTGDSFQYDPFGRRVAKTIVSTTTNFLYDGANAVQELSGSTVTANLLTGLGADERFTRTDSSATANFLTDAVGSTLELTNSGASSLASYSYDPFGNTTITGSSASTYQYTGREDDGTGVYYYRARYYSPSIQRFASEDPIGFAFGPNLYQYTFDSPTNLIDPSGASAVDYLLPDWVNQNLPWNYIPGICRADSFRFFGAGGENANSEGGAYGIDEVHYSNTSSEGWHVTGMESGTLVEGFGQNWGAGVVLSGRKPKEALLFPPSPYHREFNRQLGPIKLRAEGGLGPLLGYGDNGFSVGFYGDVGAGAGVGSYGGGFGGGGGWSVTFSSAAACAAQ